MILSLIQWNIYSGEDLGHISAFLASNAADIICLQELPVGRPERDYVHGPAFVADQLRYALAFVELPNRFPDGRPAVLANAILSRFEVKSQRSAIINRPVGRSNGFDNQYRGYIEATFDVGSCNLTVGTAHMSYTNRFEVTARRKAETERLLAVIGGKTHNYVLTGDLNATPESCIVARIGERFVNVGPDVTLATWTTKPFSYSGFEANSLSWRLDYMFATRDVKVVSARILETEYSDHLPILAIVEVGNESDVEQ